MPKLVRVRVRVLAVALILLGLPTLARAADTAPVAAHNDMADFTTEYTTKVMLGIAGGGLLMRLAVGGATATLAGALVGSALASWLFINEESHNYVVQRARPNEGR